MKGTLKIALGVTGLAAAIVWSFHGVDLRRMGDSLLAMNLRIMGIVLFLTILNLLIRAMVWKAVLFPVKSISLRQSFANYLLGVFTNLFLPMKLGDLVQGISLGKSESISKVSAVSAVMVQRMFEIVSLVLIALGVMLAFSFPSSFRSRTVYGIVALSSAILLFALLFNLRGKIDLLLSVRLRWISPNVLETIRRSFRHFLEGTAVVRNYPDTLKILGLSLLSWAVQIMMVLVTAQALAIHLTIVSGAIVLLVINLGLCIPVSPGNIGTFQVFSIAALSLYAVPKAEALGFSIVFQAIQGVPVVIGGGMSLFAFMVPARVKAPAVIPVSHHDRAILTKGNIST
jgi:glycosyltransferase 2 family protein